MADRHNRLVLLAMLLLPACGGAERGPRAEQTRFVSEEGRGAETRAPSRSEGAGHDLPYVRLPDGFRLGIFAEGIPGVRFLALDPAGRLTASVPNESRILLLPDEDGDGRADAIGTFDEGIRAVHGIDWYEGALYAAGTGSLWRLRDTDGDGVADERRLLSEDIPPGGGHWTRTVVVGPGPDHEPHLYVSAGSTCNVCIEDDPRRAAVMRFPLSGGEGELFARGLRNSVGLAWRPGTDELWATDNGRDRLGDDIPPDELNHLREGRFYGWPYWYGDNVRDPKYRGRELPPHARDPVPAGLGFQAHSAPLGLCFYDGEMFPAQYRGDLFVGFHGSWNRSVPTGYKVVRVRFDKGRPTGYEDFLTGFLELEPSVRKRGRPVDCLVAPDGALLVSDDGAGRIYRITYAR